MASAKRQREESENDEGEQESNSEQSSDDESSASESSDSEGSSELDGDELDKRKEEVAVTMNEMEASFLVARESLYLERITLNTQRLEELKRGDAIEYVSPLKALREEAESRFEVIEQLYKMKLNFCETRYDADLRTTKQSLENDKEHLQDCIQADIHEKIRKLEEDKNNVDISSEAWSSRLTNNKHQKNVHSSYNPSESKKRKPVTVSGPYIVYNLQEEDILEDWTTIRRAVTASKRKSKYIKLSASPHPFPEGLAF